MKDIVMGWTHNSEETDNLEIFFFFFPGKSLG
jgi:hypothetical protein